jgi:hypothetical protein
MELIEQGVRFGAAHSLEPGPLPDCPGIYFLCKRAEIVYAGKAVSIARRVPQHRGVKDFDSVLVLRAPEKLLNSVEVYWIKRLGPKFNKNGLGKVRVLLRPRPYGRGKKPKLFLLTPDVIRRLESAARKSKISQTAYLEAALEAKFKKDGIDTD